MSGPGGIITIANCLSGFYLRESSPGKRGINQFKSVLSRLLLVTPQAWKQLKPDINLLKTLQEDLGKDGKGSIKLRTVNALLDKGFVVLFFPARNQPKEKGYFGLRLAGEPEEREFEMARRSLFEASFRNIEIHSKLMGMEFAGLREQRLSPAELKVLLARVCVENNPDILGLSPIEEVIGKVSVLPDESPARPDTLDRMPDGRMHLKIARAKLTQYAVDPPEFGIELKISED